MTESRTNAGQPSAEFYYTVDGNRVGPVTAHKIKELADDNTITPRTLIWKHGMEDWIPAGQVKSLFAGQTENILTAEDMSVGAERGNVAEDQPAFRNPVDTYGVAHTQLASPSSQTGVGISAARQRKSVHFEGAVAPSIALLPNECILDEFEAGFWDLGIVGHFLGYKRRLVLTTHRLFRFDKKIVDNVLEIVWLRSVKLVVVGQTVNGLLAAFGAFVILGAAGQLLGGVWGRRIGELGAFSGVLPGLLGLGFGSAMIALAFRKVMTVSTGVDKTGLKLVRIRSDESKRFVDKIFAALARMSP